MFFEGAAFAEVIRSPAASRLAYLVLLLGATSLALSQSVVLFANRVPPVRFLFALAVSGIQFALSAVAYGLAFVVAAQALGVDAAGPGGVLALVALSWAPYFLALFAIVPHFGLGWQRILEGWVAALMVFALADGLGVSLAIALAIGILGWGIGYAANLLIGPLLGRIGWRLLEIATGRQLEATVDPVAVLRKSAATLDVPEARP
ncbi:MAG: hypothetical protein ACK4MX_02155 [Thermaurantiacus sp.]